MYKRIRKVLLNYIPDLIKTSFIYKLPFLYRFLEIRPSSCTAMITNRCNLRCVMCKQWREPAEEELSTGEWKNIILDLRKSGIRNIHFTGGEPFLREDLSELISYSRHNGFVVGVTTNAILATKGILEDIIKSGLKSIAISMDAVEDKYDSIRGLPGSFKRLKENLIIISEIKKRKKIDTYINFTLMKDTIKELKAVKRIADELQIPIAINILDKNSFIFNLEENSNKFWITKEKDFEDLKDILSLLRNEKIKNPKSLIINFSAIDFIENYFRDPRQEQIPCISSQDRIIIDAYGNLLGGCMSMGSFGNLKDRALKELWQEKIYQRAKGNMFYKKCAGCSCGYLFNIKLFLPFIIKDIARRLKPSALERKKCLKKN